MMGADSTGEMDERTTTKEPVDESSAAHPPQMLRIDIQIRHEAHGYRHIGNYSPVALSDRAKVRTHIFPLDRVQRCQCWIKAVLKEVEPCQRRPSTTRFSIRRRICRYLGSE